MTNDQTPMTNVQQERSWDLVIGYLGVEIRHLRSRRFQCQSRNNEGDWVFGIRISLVIMV